MSLQDKNARVSLEGSPPLNKTSSFVQQPRPSLELATTFKLVSSTISSVEEVRRRSIETSRPSLQIQVPQHLSAIPAQQEMAKEVLKDLEITYHLVPIDELTGKLQTDVKNGISDVEAKVRLQRDGANVFTIKSYRWILDVLYYYFGGLSILLWIASVLCILAYQPFGGSNPDANNIGLAVVIWIVIFVQGTFTLYQDWSSSRVMNSIKNMMPDFSTVIRDGHIVKVPTKEIVVGDIVKLETGQRVPADVRLVELHMLKVDAAILTGECEPISCTLHHTDTNFLETKNLLFMGSSVVEGSGVGICVATGLRSVMGKISRLAATTKKGTSTLRTHMNRLVIGVALTGFALATAMIIFWVAFLRTTFPNFTSASGLLGSCIALMVSVVPEGLPISLTLALTVSAKRIFRENVLVKSLPTVETLGAVDVIASDKTGTLTQNKMRVCSIFSGMRSIDNQEVFHHFEKNDTAVLELINSLALCNRASFESGENVPIEQRSVIGDASDTAFLIFAEQFVRVASIRASNPVLAQIPFHSKNKWMLSIVKTSSGPTLYMKGASEIILQKCKTMLNEQGQEVPLTDEIRDKIGKQIEELCDHGQRVLGSAKLHLNKQTFTDDFEYDTEERNFPMEGLCFLGLGAIFDPPRDDVEEAIRVCHEASIKVMMVTGDHHTTAVAIAKMIGLVHNGNTVVRYTSASNPKELEQSDPKHENALAIRGEDIASFDKDDWKFIFKHEEIVFARTTPEHKLIIVRECQKQKHCVAVTGDGVNDAPALKTANVGVAMGDGSDVAREAADIILLDSRFSKIVKSIEYGRLVFENLRKVIIFVFPAGNWCEMLAIFANAFLGLPLPLSSFLMICICVATDIGTTLSLIMEEPEGDLMHRPPYTKTGESLVNIQLFLHAFVFLGMIEAIGCFIMYFSYFWWFANINPLQLILAFDKWDEGYLGYTKVQLMEHLYMAQSCYFAAIVIMQCGQLLSTRTQRLSFFQHLPFLKKSRNIYLLFGMISSATLAIFFLYLPLFQNLFYTREIPTQFWFMPMAFAVIVFVLDELRKLLKNLVNNRIAAWKTQRLGAQV